MLASLLLLALSGPLSSPAAAAEPHDFVCCERPAVTAVVDAWLGLHEALVKGDDPTPGLKAVAAAARARMPPSERPVAEELAAAADELVGADAERLRADLGEVSRRVVWLALRAEGGTRQVVQVRCAGLGVWLQADTRTVQNPWGARCGHFL